MMSGTMILLCLLSLLCSVSADPYYVKAGKNAYCPGVRCQTLQGYANIPPDEPANITMLFLVGEHHLSRDTFLHNLENLTFEAVSPSTKVIIRCSSDGRLIFENINHTSIGNINMVGCYGNHMANGDQLAIANINVQGLSNYHSSQSVFNVSEIQDFEVVNGTFISVEVTGLIGMVVCSVFYIRDSNLKLLQSVFDQNCADSENSPDDGMSSNMCIYGTTIFIEGSNFTDNRAKTGGVLYAEDSSIRISKSRFLNNHANDSGGCGHITNSTLHIVGSSLFDGNSAENLGGAFMAQSSTILINSVSHSESDDYTEPCNGSMVVFVGNSAELGGALNIIEDSVVNIHCSTFWLNHAESQEKESECRGGAVLARTNSTISLSNSIFHENTAKNKGGVLFTQYAIIHGSGWLSILMNRAETGAVYITNSTASFSGNLTFANNTNSFYAHSSEVTFGGESRFEGGKSDSEDEGGAITAVRSTVMISNTFFLQYNEGVKGGGIQLTESVLTVQGQYKHVFQNNEAKKGGAVSAYKSNIKFSGDTIIEGNVARSNGGGLFLVRSDVEYRSRFLSFYNNTASNRGGAIYFDQMSTLYIIKKNIECEKGAWYCVSNSSEWLLLTFRGNSVKQGGAM